MNESKDHQDRVTAEKAFQESLEELEKLSKLKETKSIASNNSKIKPDSDIAEWEEAAADLDNFFNNLNDKK